MTSHSRTQKYAAALVTSLLLGGAATSAAAQTKPPASEPAPGSAEALYRAGNVAYDAGKFEEAYTLYKQAFETRKSFEISGDLGHACMKLGRMAEAARYLRYSLSVFPTSGNRERKATTEQLFAEAKAAVGTVKVTANVTDARVSLDGAEVARTPVSDPIFVDPGGHTLRIEREGYKAQELIIAVQPGTELPQSFKLERDGSSGDGRPIWPAILLGIGAAAGIGTGIGLIIVSSNKNGDAEAALRDCTADAATCESDAADMVGSANGLLGGGVTALSLGAAAAIGMVVYLALPSPAKNTSLTIVPMFGATTGAQLQLNF